MTKMIFCITAVILLAASGCKDGGQEYGDQFASSFFRQGQILTPKEREDLYRSKVKCLFVARLTGVYLDQGKTKVGESDIGVVPDLGEENGFVKSARIFGDKYEVVYLKREDLVEKMEDTRYMKDKNPPLPVWDSKVVGDPNGVCRPPA